MQWSLRSHELKHPKILFICSIKPDKILLAQLHNMLDITMTTIGEEKEA